PWDAWDSEDFHAIEIWNHLSEWMERLTRRNKWWLYVNPRRSVIRPTAWTLEKWDSLNLQRRVVGVGGVDAHAHHYPIWQNLSATIFPYKVAFRSIQVHVLLENPLEKQNAEKALQSLFTAMRSGHVFVTNRYVGDARGFRFWADNENDGAVCQMGDRLPAASRLRFHYRLPADATSAVLLKNTQPLHRIKEHSGSCNSSGPGVYRIEGFRHRRAFIYSNPIVITA
ncbi:histidinol-phosphatase, partial [bacterium]|nr:histidinol-phosphatase [bacterium]